MKTKLSVTLDEQLLAFVDSEHGPSRSEKIERILRQYRDARRDSQLRRDLAAFNVQGNDDADAWREAMEEAQWSESGEATSGRSRSRRSRSRGRR